MKSLGRDPLWFALRRARASAPPRVIRFGLLLLVVSTVFFPALPTRAQEPVVTFTMAEADRGRAVYTEQCAQCHGSELSDGFAPALLGPTFRRTWSRPQVTVNDLHYIISATMPPARPGSLSEAQYLEVLAYIMAENGVAAGLEPLRAEQRRLENISLIPLELPTERDVTGPRDSTPNRRSWVLTHLIGGY